MKNAALRKRNLGVSAFRVWGEESVGRSSFLVYFEKLGFGLWAYIITPATSTTIIISAIIILLIITIIKRRCRGRCWGLDLEGGGLPRAKPTLRICLLGLTGFCRVFAK